MTIMYLAGQSGAVIATARRVVAREEMTRR